VQVVLSNIFFSEMSIIVMVLTLSCVVLFTVRWSGVLGKLLRILHFFIVVSSTFIILSWSFRYLQRIEHVFLLLKNFPEVFFKMSCLEFADLQYLGMGIITGVITIVAVLLLINRDFHSTID